MNSIEPKPLSPMQRTMWHSASLTYGTVLAIFAAKTGAIESATEIFPIAVFFVFWLVGVVGFRSVFAGLSPEPTPRELLQLPSWLKKRK